MNHCIDSVTNFFLCHVSPLTLRVHCTTMTMIIRQRQWPRYKPETPKVIIWMLCRLWRGWAFTVAGSWRPSLALLVVQFNWEYYTVLSLNTNTTQIQMLKAMFSFARRRSCCAFWLTSKSITQYFCKVLVLQLFGQGKSKWEWDRVSVGGQ